MGWIKVNGQFSVSSAYKLYMGTQGIEVPWKGWRRIWKLQIQQRIKTFIWTLAHDRILTNQGKWKRKMTNNPSSFICSCAMEDTLANFVKSCGIVYPPSHASSNHFLQPIDPSQPELYHCLGKVVRSHHAAVCLLTSSLPKTGSSSINCLQA